MVFGAICKKPLDRLAVDAGLDGDRLAGLALEAAEQPADDERGVGPFLGDRSGAGNVAGRS
jgi:hypothetical protein